MSSQEQTNEGMSTVLKGCFLVAILVVVAGAFGAYYAIQNGMSLVASLGVDGVVQVIGDSDMSESQKEDSVAHLERFRTGVEDGTIDMASFGQAMEALVEGNLLYSMALAGFDQGYLKESGFTDEQKEDARLQLQRYARGMKQKVFNGDTFDEHFDPLLLSSDGDGQREFKTPISDQELMQAIENARGAADKASISHEPYEIDVAREIGKVVDVALGLEVEKE